MKAILGILIVLAALAFVWGNIAVRKWRRGVDALEQKYEDRYQFGETILTRAQNALAADALREALRAASELRALRYELRDMQKVIVDELGRKPFGLPLAKDEKEILATFERLIAGNKRMDEEDARPKGVKRSPRPPSTPDPVTEILRKYGKP
jgi:hypothetical protein